VAQGPSARTPVDRRGAGHVAELRVGVFSLRGIGDSNYRSRRHVYREPSGIQLAVAVLPPRFAEHGFSAARGYRRGEANGELIDLGPFLLAADP
jgi:hypothetical protein